ncbi:MAG: hypothetical protein ACK5Y2_00385 [Bdellovibrionales bacterium]
MVHLHTMSENANRDPETDSDFEPGRKADIVGDQESVESRRDESQIITDQDMTNEGDITALDENMGAMTNSLEQIEDEPAEFVRGEIDVVEQMKRTTRAMEDTIERSTGRRAHLKKDTYHKE